MMRKLSARGAGVVRSSKVAAKVPVRVLAQNFTSTSAVSSSSAETQALIRSISEEQNQVTSRVSCYELALFDAYSIVLC